MLAMRCLIFAVALLILPQSLAAQNAAERGRAIADKAAAADAGWGDARATLSMQIIGRNGDTAQRQLDFASLEASGNRGTQSLLIFEAPADVRDTALLTHNKTQGSDDQWIYLPALKRVTRISGATRASPFMGSEFAYEDFIAAEVERFRYSWLRDEPCGTLTCSVVERVPLYADSGYAKQLVWFDSSGWRIQRIEFTNRRGQMVKTLNASGWVQHKGRYWRAQDLLMVNHLSGARTRLTWTAFRFGTGLGERHFSSTGLGR
jgi:outer membrane lipoprotein-sorting protein